MINNIKTASVKVSAAVSFIGILVALIAIAAAFMMSSDRFVTKSPEVSIERSLEIRELTTHVQSKFDELNKIIENQPGILDKVQMSELKSRMDKIEQDITSLRQLLFDNPDAAITLPLMKKDIDSLQNDMKTTREMFAWITSYNKWIIGIMIPLSVSVLGLVITTVLKK